jgi:hypothetical protein
MPQFVKLHWLTIVGGPTVWHHVLTWGTRMQNKWAKKGIKNGAWGYYLMAGRKALGAGKLTLEQQLKQGSTAAPGAHPPIEVNAGGGSPNGVASPAGGAGAAWKVPTGGCFEQ